MDVPVAKECGLDQGYQMLSLLYMLLIYCEIVIFAIFSCSVRTYMTRFFMIVDEIPTDEQRRLPVGEGGRGHPLMRRSFFEYKHAFGYAWYVMARGRINRAHEIRELQSYRTRMREKNLRNRIQVATYKCSKQSKVAEEVPKEEESIDSLRENLISTNSTEAASEDNSNSISDVEDLESQTSS